MPCLLLILTTLKAETNEKRTLNLTYPTNEFMKLTKLWDQFVDGEMKIYVKNIKSWVSSRSLSSRSIDVPQRLPP